MKRTIVVGLHDVDGDAVAERDADEMSDGHARREPEHSGQELGRRSLVVGRENDVVERNGHDVASSARVWTMPSPLRYMCGGLWPASWPPSIGTVAPVMNDAC